MSALDIFILSAGPTGILAAVAMVVFWNADGGRLGIWALLISVLCLTSCTTSCIARTLPCDHEACE